MGRWPSNDAKYQCAHENSQTTQRFHQHLEGETAGGVVWPPSMGKVGHSRRSIRCVMLTSSDDRLHGSDSVCRRSLDSVLETIMRLCLWTIFDSCLQTIAKHVMQLVAHWCRWQQA